MKGEPTAIVLNRDGVVRHDQRHAEFPFVQLAPGQLLPRLHEPTDRIALSDFQEAYTRDWSSNRRTEALLVQSLHQSDGYAMTLLSLDDDEA